MNRLEQLQEFLKSDPEDPFISYAIAMEHIGQNNDSEAKNILVDLRLRNPTYTALYYHLGMLYIRAGELSEAQNVFEEGIRLTTLAKEQREFAELQTALNNLLYDDE